MSYAWIVDQDLTTSTRVGATGGPKSHTIPPHGGGHKFRLLDDDGEPYYLGRFFGDPSSEEAFAPLDDFGAPNAGCTEIQYLNNGQWETL